jgi:hypothetical protein
MGESTANALASTPAPKKAMTRTMEKLGKIQPRPSNCDSFRASTKKCTFTRKIRPAAGSLRGNCGSGSKPAAQRSAGSASPSASLRSVRTKMPKFPLRGGNDAPWKTPQASFPPRLEIRQKAPDSHIPTTSTAGPISLFPKLYRAPPSSNSLTDADHFGQDPSASVASLRW